MIDAHDSDWRPSQRQAIFHELPAEFRRWCGTEVTTSASIIIMLLLDWSSRLRRGHQKQAQLVLADLLQKTLPRLFHVIPAEVYALPDADEAACSFRGPAGLGACRHCANIYEGLPQQLGCSELVGLLHKVWAKKDVCPILKQWCGFVIPRHSQSPRRLPGPRGWVADECQRSCRSQRHEAEAQSGS